MKQIIIEDLKAMKTEVSPFSNGTEAMSWLHSNCEDCTKSFLRRNPSIEMPDFDESLNLCESGKECPGKLSLDMAYIIGTIPHSAVEYIWGNSENMHQLKDCLHYSDDDFDENYTDNLPPSDPNQLLIPFDITDLFDFGEDVVMTDKAIFHADLVAY